jgi:hypothetical protein
MAITDDLNTGLLAIGAKKAKYDELWDYYDGNHPLKYSTERLRDIFGNIHSSFCENWMQVVVDAAVDRIELNGFNTEEKGIKERLDVLFDSMKLKLDADDVHLAAVVTGEGCLIGEVVDDVPGLYYNDPRMVHVQYDEDNPKRKKYAVKLYWDGEAWRAIVYTDKAVHRFVAPKKELDLVGKTNPSEQFVSEGDGEVPVDGVIPVFHFRLSRRKYKGDIETVLPIQDAINKLIADMMVSAEFSAFKQRWVISNADSATIPNAPNQIIMLPAGDGDGQPTAVGEFTETTLEGFFKAVDRFAQSIAIITRTPKHYLYAQGGDPSGEALIAMEAPLVKRVENHIERFSVTWEEVADWLLAIESTVAEVESMFANVATVQPRTQAEIRALNVQAGIPITTTLRDDGWTEEELKQMEADKKAESTEREESEARMAANAMQMMDRGGNVPE